MQTIFTYFKRLFSIQKGYLFLEVPLFFVISFYRNLLESLSKRYPWCISR